MPRCPLGPAAAQYGGSFLGTGHTTPSDGVRVRVVNT